MKTKILADFQICIRVPLRSISVNLRILLGVILFDAFIKKAKVTVKSRIKAIAYQLTKITTILCKHNN